MARRQLEPRMGSDGRPVRAGIAVAHPGPNARPLVIPTPFGKSLAIEFSSDEIIASSWVALDVAPSQRMRSGALVRETIRQVNAYLAKRLAVFEVPLFLAGSPFELAVWSAVRTIPFGTRVSYADVARAVDRPGLHRAVARAMAKTPFALLIPAHRVVGADGKIKGAEKNSMRARLLAFESPATEKTAATRVDSSAELG
jgi:methylated-DNA-[protein]-cysteine S-methyltransferase